MKMEINVNATDDLVGKTVEAIVARPGTTVESGDVLIVARQK
jgi:biotin carboxyl carrier protein